MTIDQLDENYILSVSMNNGFSLTPTNMKRFMEEVYDHPEALKEMRMSQIMFLFFLENPNINPHTEGVKISEELEYSLGDRTPEQLTSILIQCLDCHELIKAFIKDNSRSKVTQ